MAKYDWSGGNKAAKQEAADAAARAIAEAAKTAQIPEDDEVLYGDGVTDEPPKEEPQGAQGEQDDDTDDTDPFAGLTPYTRDGQPASPYTYPTAKQEPEREVDLSAKEQQDNLDDLYKSLEFLDEDSTKELKQKVIDPIVQAQNERLARLEQERLKEQERDAKARMDATTQKILAKYPNAANILNSEQFINFLNRGSDKYDAEKPSDKLARAYYQYGDAEYVIDKLDEFVKARKKPKPPVGAEPQQGRGTSGVISIPKGRKMSYEEYMAAVAKIQAAPRGTYPPHAIRDLTLKYQNQLRGD